MINDAYGAWITWNSDSTRISLVAMVARIVVCVHLKYIYKKCYIQNKILMINDNGECGLASQCLIDLVINK